MSNLQAVLSRGIQHASPVVQLVTLQALAVLLDAIQPLLSTLTRLAHASRSLPPPLSSHASSQHTLPHPNPTVAKHTKASKGSQGSAGAWVISLTRLRATLRARLPDLQTLLAVHASLTKQLGTAKLATAAQVPGSNVAGDGLEGEGQRLLLQQRQEQQLRAEEENQKAQQQLQQKLKGQPESTEVEKSELKKEEAEEDPELQHITASLFGFDAPLQDLEPGSVESAGTRRVRQCERLVCDALAVVACYSRWMPEAVADLRVDPFRLLPQVGGSGSRVVGA